ncbi:MAG TPA: hypothetical protein VFM45_13450 [Anaeromyxobacteraceae bacterium]|nr:hypothetical protein [Anaeromyxobacteraceae bacterium]
MPLRPTWVPVLALALAACTTATRFPDAQPGAGAAAAAPDAAALLRAGDEAMRSARFDDAARSYEAAARVAPSDPRPLLGIAKVRFALGEIPAGMEALDRSIALGETAEALYLRGRSLGIARKFERAAPDLERSLALGGGDGSAWPVLAAVQVNLGDDVRARLAYEGAVQALGEAVAVDRFWTMLLAMPPDPGQPQEALDRCSRSQAAMFQGRWPEAAHEQRNGLRKSPGFTYCIALAGVTAARLGDPASGERAIRRAIADMSDRLAPLRADAQAWLGALLLEKDGGAKEATALARASLAVRGDRAGTLDLLARACTATGDEACAREATERLLRLPGLPEAMRAEASRRLSAAGPASAAPR